MSTKSKQQPDILDKVKEVLKKNQNKKGLGNRLILLLFIGGYEHKI
ncbi:hypothetical protein ACO2FM_09505 [Staphylococcus pasteuri]